MHGPQHREGEEKRENLRFPFKFWEKIAKTSIFEFPQPSRFIFTGLELGKPKFDRFPDPRLFKLGRFAPTKG